MSPSRLAATALLALAALPAGPALAAGAFPDGVASGDATAHGARLWTRASRPGPLVLVVSRRPDLRRPVARRALQARAASGAAAKVTVGGLRPGLRYFFRFFRGPARSPRGSFTTLPPADSSRALRFAVSGGFDRTWDHNMSVARRMAGERNPFNVLLGSTILSEGAGSLTALRGRYATTFADPRLANLRGAGAYATWGAGELPTGRATGAARRAFLESTPTAASRSTGLYRRIRWGRTAELFVLDERAFRSPQADLSPACRNPSTHRPDIAPTMPRRQRDDYSGYFGSLLSAPVDPKCTGLIADRSRTLLGRQQLKRFLYDVSHSRAKFKIVLSEAPFSQAYFLPYDRWEGYAAERRQVLEALRQSADHVVFLSAGSGDAIGEVRLQTLEEPGVMGTGFTEFGTGPAAAPTWFERFEAAAVPGTGDVAQQTWLVRPVPYGAAERCTQTHTLSYSQVVVTPARISVSLRDLQGRVVRDPTGAPCGTFAIDADGFMLRPY